MVGTETENSSNGGFSRAKIGITATSLANDFAMAAVLLAIKREGDKGGCPELIVGNSGEVETSGTNKKLHTC